MWSTLLAAALLLLTLGFAVVRPRGLPETVAAVPDAVLAVAVGLVGWRSALAEIGQLAPTVIFLLAVLVLADLCRDEGLFAAAGSFMARRARGSGTRLLGLTFVVASLTTAVLSLDATVVLLTPVVFVTATRLGVRPRPQVYATTHLANSASLLLPVSNLTNLLALRSSGLGFLSFAGLMFAPWLAAIAIEYVVLRRWFRPDLSLHADPAEPPPAVPFPRFALVVLGLTLVGFVLCGPLGLEAYWAALAGALVLAARRLVTAGGPGERGRRLRRLGASVNLWFAAFVLGLGVVVRAVMEHGLSGALGRVVPSGDGLLALLALAGLAAVLANVVNNLPAVLVLLPLVEPLGAPAVLAVLIGVNIGPNLTYVGSLATLLWRRILADHDHDTELREFTLLGAITVPLCLVVCTTLLWWGARLMGV